MEKKNNNQSADQDFTGKGRTNNSGRNDAANDTDISKVDQQEGELKHGATGADQHLFSDDEIAPNERS